MGAPACRHGIGDAYTLGIPPHFIAYLFQVQFNGGIDIYYSGSDPSISHAILPAQDPNIYDATYAYVTAASAPVPEPTSAALVLGAGAMLLLRRRRAAVQ